MFTHFAFSSSTRDPELLGSLASRLHHKWVCRSAAYTAMGISCGDVSHYGFQIAFSMLCAQWHASCFRFLCPTFFFFPAHLLSSPFYSFSPLVVTQIRGHTAGYSPSLPTAARTLHFNRENLWVLLSSTRVEFTLSYKSCLYIIMSWVGEASDRYSRRMNSIICTTYILQLIPYQVLRCAVLHNNEKRQMWDRGFRRNSCSFASFVGFYDRAYVRVLCDLIKTVKSSLRGKDALLGESGKTIYFS